MGFGEMRTLYPGLCIFPSFREAKRGMPSAVPKQFGEQGESTPSDITANALAPMSAGSTHPPDLRLGLRWSTLLRLPRKEGKAILVHSTCGLSV